MWCNPQGLPKAARRAAIQPFILVQLATLLYFSPWSACSAPGLPRCTCPGAPVVLLGTWIGLRFFGRIKGGDFNAVVLIFPLASGATLAL